jgi:hypothetical protein
MVEIKMMNSIEKIQRLLTAFGYPVENTGNTLEEIKQTEIRLGVELPQLLKDFYACIGKHPLFQNKNGFSINICELQYLEFFSDADSEDFAEPSITFLSSDDNEGYYQARMIRMSELKNPDPCCEAFFMDGITGKILLSQEIELLVLHNISMELEQKVGISLKDKYWENIDLKVKQNYPEIIEGVYGGEGLLIGNGIKADSPAKLLEALKKIGLHKYKLIIDLYFYPHTKFNPHLLKDFIMSEINLYTDEDDYHAGSLSRLVEYLENHGNLDTQDKSYDFEIKPTITSWKKKENDVFLQDMLRKEQSKEISTLIQDGLSEVNESQNITLPAKNVLHLFQTLKELKRYFEGKDNYPTIFDLETFLGDDETGAIHEINKGLENLSPFIPKILEKEVPFYPYYFYKRYDDRYQDGTLEVTDLKAFQEFIQKQSEEYDNKALKEIKERGWDEEIGKEINIKMFLEKLADISDYKKDNKFQIETPKDVPTWRNFARLIQKTINALIFVKLRDVARKKG